jgi:16S rRNA G527 N7-methylase RsmG
LLDTWNRTIRLVGKADPTTIVEDHFPDSFALAQLIWDSSREVLDGLVEAENSAYADKKPNAATSRYGQPLSTTGPARAAPLKAPAPGESPRLRASDMSQCRPRADTRLPNAGTATKKELPSEYRCLDAGSGAGLPGIPVAVLCPMARVVLVEANQRKCAFLRTAVHELHLPAVSVIDGRLEKQDLSDFDLAWSKATWGPAEWLHRAERLVSAQGRIVVLAATVEACPGSSAGLDLAETRHYSSARGKRVLSLYQHRER